MPNFTSVLGILICTAIIVLFYYKTLTFFNFKWLHDCVRWCRLLFLEQQNLFNNKLSMYHVHCQSKPGSFDVMLYRFYKQWISSRVVFPGTLCWYTNYNFSGLSGRALKHPLECICITGCYMSCDLFIFLTLLALSM